MAKPSAPSAADRRQAVRAEQQRQAAAARRRRNLIQLGIVGGVAVVVIVIIGSAVFIAERGRSNQSTTPAADTTITVNDVSVPFAVDGSAVRVGPADAKAKIDLWVDYSCPHCQEFEADNNAALNQLIAAGNVSVSYHNIQIVTDYGTEAGGAAACVATNDPAHWVAFNASLYANHSADSDGWKAAQFRGFAADQGVNSAALDCITTSRYDSWIALNTAESGQQGVKSTPTMFLNGEPSEVLTGQALIAKVNQLAGR